MLVHDVAVSRTRTRHVPAHLARIAATTSSLLRRPLPPQLRRAFDKRENKRSPSLTRSRTRSSTMRNAHRSSRIARICWRGAALRVARSDSPRMVGRSRRLSDAPNWVCRMFGPVVIISTAASAGHLSCRGDRHRGQRRLPRGVSRPLRSWVPRSLGYPGPRPKSGDRDRCRFCRCLGTGHARNQQHRVLRCRWFLLVPTREASQRDDYLMKPSFFR